MPPHCDAVDGPVVKACMKALDAQDVEIALAFVDEASEAEVRTIFEEVSEIRTLRATVREIADRLFAETVVRLHRASEGAPFTGLKPAGLDHGPVIPVAERAIETGSAEELIHELTHEVEVEVKARLDGVLALQARAHEGLRATREYTSAMLAFQVWSNQAHRSLRADPRELH